MTNELKIWRSPYLASEPNLLDCIADRAPETVTANACYTDAVLADIAAQGFNGIWVAGELIKEVPSSVFPELAADTDARQRNMAALIDRARAHGVGVYLYMTPAYGLRAGDPFWEDHVDVGGTSQDRSSKHLGGSGIVRAFCTSTPKVQDFLSESSERLATALPGLAGIILITASERPSHCYSKYPYTGYKIGGGPRETVPLECPRCRERHPVDVMMEMIKLIHGGVRSASKGMHVICWNWAWDMYEPRPCPRTVAALPKDVILMVGLERGSTKVILGKERHIDEYSLSCPGPSEQFIGFTKVAKKNGLRTMAKLQIGTTHELATVPNLPLIGNLHEKAKGMRRWGVTSFLGTWKLGCMSSANTAAFNRFMTLDKLPPKRNALIDFAADYFPGCAADMVADAWDMFAAAMDNYPYTVPFLYHSAINYTLAYPLRAGRARKEQAGRSWVIDKRGEWLGDSLWPFTLNEVIKGLGALARQWKKGATTFERGLKACNAPAAREELDNAWVCYHIFRSAWNSYRAFRLKKRWTAAKLPAYRRILKNELPNLQAVLPILRRDKRFGFHPECQAYMFTAETVAGKIRSLKRQLRQE